MNRLQIINEVLAKLREPLVATSIENPYSSMVLQFVKESYNEVVKHAEWSWLRQQVFPSGTSLNTGYPYTQLDYAQANVISLWDDTLKYFVPRHPDLKVAQTHATAYPLTLGPAQFYYTRPYTGGAILPTLSVWPVVPSTNSFILTLEGVQDIGSTADSVAVRCPGYLLVLGAFEKALLERDGDTAQYQRALSAYTMAVSSQVSMDSALDQRSTDWVPE